MSVDAPIPNEPASTDESTHPAVMDLRARRIANLKPWKKGQKSPNPSGKRKGGLPTQRQILGGTAYRDALNAFLAAPGRLEGLVGAMYSLALNGNASAIQHIFQRLDPIKDDQSGRKVLEGLTLEISREGVKLQLPTQQETITPVETTGCVGNGEPALLPSRNES